MLLLCSTVLRGKAKEHLQMMTLFVCVYEIIPWRNIQDLLDGD